MHSGLTVIRGRRRVITIILTGFLYVWLPKSAADNDAFWHVVIFHGADMLPPVSLTVEKATSETLLAGTTQKIEFDSEPLDALSLQGATVEPALVESLRKKYENRGPQLFVVAGFPALNCTGGWPRSVSGNQLFLLRRMTRLQHPNKPKRLENIYRNHFLAKT